MADLEETILEDIELQSRVWRRYIDDIVSIWEHGEDSLKHPQLNLLRNGQKKK